MSCTAHPRQWWQRRGPTDSSAQGWLSTPCSRPSCWTSEGRSPLERPRCAASCWAAKYSSEGVPLADTRVWGQYSSCTHSASPGCRVPAGAPAQPERERCAVQARALRPARARSTREAWAGSPPRHPPTDGAGTCARQCGYPVCSGVLPFSSRVPSCARRRQWGLRAPPHACAARGRARLQGIQAGERPEQQALAHAAGAPHEEHLLVVELEAEAAEDCLVRAHRSPQGPGLQQAVRHAITALIKPKRSQAVLRLRTVLPGGASRGP